MYESVSNEFKEIVKSNSITASAKLVFKDPNITLLGKAVEPLKSSLQELKITDNCYDKENGKLIGTVATKEVEITIINKDNLDLANKEFSLFPGVKLSNGTFEYVPYGNFIITDYKDMKHDNTFKLIAYDYMTKLNSKFSDNKVFKPIFPITLKQFKIQFLASYGLECEEQILPNDNFIIKAMPGFEGMSARAILGRIAELQGSFAKINRNNKVQFYLKTPTDRKRDTIKNGNTLYLEAVLKSNALDYTVEGNTTQETRKGYNLIKKEGFSTPRTDTNFWRSINSNFTPLTDGWGRANFDGKQTSQYCNSLIKAEGLNIKPNTEYTIIFEIRKKIGNIYLVFGDFNNEGFFTTSVSKISSNGIHKIKVMSKSDITNKIFRVYTNSSHSLTEVCSMEYRAMIVEGDHTQDNLPYEKYGAMPSPEFPSEVECVGGYNLLDMQNSKDGTAYGITCEVNDDGSYSFIGQATDTNINVWFKGGYNITSPILFTLKAGTYYIKDICLYYDKTQFKDKVIFEKDQPITGIRATTAVVGKDYNEILFPMITKIENKDKPYLPYGNIGIKINGKNLYNNTPLKRGLWISGSGLGGNNSGWYIIVPIIGEKEYIITKKNTIGSIYTTTTAEYPQQGIPIIDKWTGSGNRKELKITTSQNAKYLFIGLFAGNPTEMQQKQCIEELQVEEGNTATLYEPYKETIVPIDLKGKELCKIGENKDLLNIDSNGKTTINKRYAKYVFTGEESFTLQNINANGIANFGYAHNLKSIDNEARCNYFKKQTTAIANTKEDGILWQKNHVYLRIEQEIASTPEQFKQYLKDKYDSGNPVYVIYELEVPQTIQLADTTIPLYEGVNNIELLSNIETNTSMMYNKRVPTENIDAMSMNSSLEIDNKYGGVNVVSLGMSNVEGENVTLKDDVSIQQMGKEVTIRIDDNPFVYTQELREQAIQELFNHLKGFSYVPTKFQYKARFYLDCGDQIQCEDVKSKQFVDSIVLNQYIKIPTSRQSKLENLALSDVAVKHKYISQTEQANSHTEILVDKANQKIEGVVSQIGDRSDKTTTITADLDKIFAQIQDKETLTNIVQGNKTLTLTNCHKGQLLELIVYGDNQSFLNNTTILGQSSILGKTILGWNSRIEVTYENGNKSIFDLGIKEVLRANGDIKDEYILKDGKAEIVRRINANGSIKATPIIESIGEREILLEEGKNILTILDYSPNIKATYVLKSEFSDLFTTNLEFNSEMKLTKNEFLVQLKEKVDNKDYTGAEIALKINQDKSKAVINADNIDINGVVSANGNFKVDKEGNMECNNGKFKGNVILDNGKKIIGGDGMLSNLQFFSQGQYFGFTLLGFNADYYGGESFEIHNADLTIDVLIPEDFEVESAFLVLQTTPAYWDGYDDKIQQDYKTWGNAKNLKLYKGTGNFEFILAYMSSWNAVLTNVGLIEIPNAFGGVSYTPTEKQGTSIEMKKTIDIKKYIDKGQYKLIVKSDLALPQNLTNSAINTGVAKASLNVFGYKKII